MTLIIAKQLTIISFSKIVCICKRMIKYQSIYIRRTKPKVYNEIHLCKFQVMMKKLL